MRPYSEDLRARVVAAVERGTKRSEVVETFAVSLPTIKRWLKQRRETGALTPKSISGPPAIKRDALLEALPARLAEPADATLAQHRSRWEERSGGEVSEATLK